MLIPLLIMLESVLIFTFGNMSLLHRESAGEDRNHYYVPLVMFLTVIKDNQLCQLIRGSLYLRSCSSYPLQFTL
ncbi:MAG: hypothetical protein ACXADY_08845 [Candidatus Hodarchaeales archaeon]